METIDQIMNLAEGHHHTALAALQEALALLSGSNQEKVLEYLESEEE